MYAYNILTPIFFSGLWSVQLPATEIDRSVVVLRHFDAKADTCLVALKVFIWSSNFCERETAVGENDRPAVPNRCQDSPKMLLTSKANFSHYRYFGFDL